jgi:hypothetical protein
VPTDACAGRILRYENFGEGARVDSAYLGRAFTNSTELIGNFGGGAELMRRESITQTEMDDAALCYDSAHADFAEGQCADYIDEFVVLRNGEEIGLEEEAFGKLRASLK